MINQKEQIRKAVIAKVKSEIKTPRTREEIAEETGFDDELISHVLTGLWEEGLAKIDPVSKRYCLV